MKTAANNSRFSPLARMGLAAMSEAVEEIRAERVRTGETMVVWRDGRVCHIHPAAPLVVREPSPGYSAKLR